MTIAHPLHWPVGWTRTEPHKRREAKFQTTFSVARNGLLHELKLMGATNVVLSSNVPLRKDGLPFANQRQPADPGVAVYFSRIRWINSVCRTQHLVLACDRWRKVEDNIQAVRKNVDAMRGIERWGASDVLERIFAGFDALPPPPKPTQATRRTWWEVLGVESTATVEECRRRRRELARQHHPDNGTDGCAITMAEINAALDEREKLERGA